MLKIQKILKTELQKYVGSGWRVNSRLFLLIDDEHQLYAVNAVNEPRSDKAAVVILARIVGDTVIIEEDMTDTQLVNVLIQRGIPSKQIILAYKDIAVEDVSQTT